MQAQIATLLQDALRALDIDIPADRIAVERTRDASHGDFASNIALASAKQVGCKPRELAERLVAALPASEQIAKVEIAGPGFINFTLAKDAAAAVVRAVLTQGASFGHAPKGSGEPVMVEFVSANPNGPLHVGHGRGAALGDSLANILAAAGHPVAREYYVNDAGRQMDILAASVWCRYLQQAGVDAPFPAGGYQGDYVRDVAAGLANQHGKAFVREISDVTDGLPDDAPQGGDKDAFVDALIARMRELLGADGYRTVHAAGLDSQLADIRDDLEGFGITYDTWFSEASLVETGAIQHALDTLRASGHTYEKDGALWLATSTMGDDKDRVLLRSNGAHTYFAADIAYHLNKLERGHKRLLNVWGADHHGYIPRMRAAIAALTGSDTPLVVKLSQFVSLYRGGTKVGMSTRAGEFETLRTLRAEVGNDAARFFYVMRGSDQPFDFDLELATSKTNDNPVYYIQYAHARICSVQAQTALAADAGVQHLGLLTEPQEAALLTQLAKYSEAVTLAARDYAPHVIANYLRELADQFHSYYNAHRFLLDDQAELTAARLSLAAAVKQVIANGLGLLGVSAPESM